MTTDPHQAPSGAPGGTGAPAQGAPSPGGTPQRPAPGLAFFNSIRALGLVRRDERKLVAGVCTGISQRYGIDLLLVRGIFVVLAIVGGFGAGLYGLAWLLLPHPDGRIHAEGALHGVFTAGLFGSVLLVLGDLGNGIGHTWSPFWADNWGPPRPLFAWAVLLLLVWAVVSYSNRRRGPQAPPSGGWGGGWGGGTGPQGPGTAPGAPAATTGQAAGTTPTGAPVYGTPPSPGATPAGAPPAGSGPAGESGPGEGGTAFTTGPATTAAPGTSYPTTSYPSTSYPGTSYPGTSYPGTSYPAGYPGTSYPGGYPGPGSATVGVVPPRPDLHAPSHPLTLGVLGLALVGAAVTVLSDRLGDGLPAPAGLVALGVALAIVALGVILAGLLGRRSGGLAPIAVVLALLSIGGTVGNGVHGEWGDTTTWRPASVATAEAGFTLGVGDATVDLTDPALTTGRTSADPLDIPVQLGVGRVRIVVPEGTPVQIDASVGAGNITDDVNGNATSSSGNAGGAGVKRVVHAHGDVPVIVVRTNVGLGAIEIESPGQGVTS